MLTIRLTRVGRKNDPSFRVVVVDSKKKVKAGDYLEMVGSHDPRQDRTELNAERIKYWISVGAQTSDTVHNLLVSKNIIDTKKINILPAFKAEPAPEQPAPGAAPETPEAPAEMPAEPAANPAENDPETVNSDVVEETPAA